jgi:hypothetical protein
MEHERFLICAARLGQKEDEGRKKAARNETFSIPTYRALEKPARNCTSTFC